MHSTVGNSGYKGYSVVIRWLEGGHGIGMHIPNQELYLLVRALQWLLILIRCNPLTEVGVGIVKSVFTDTRF